MKVISKTLNKVVVELTNHELEKNGFDKIWDEIREIYPDSLYEIEEVDNKNKGLVIIVLQRKNILGSYF